jgi:hypothetical protein
MGMVRTNITLPAELMALIDEVAGPRGRSAYIAEIVGKQARRDRARLVFEKYAGALKDSTTWGRTDEEVDEYFRRLRAEWDRPWISEDVDALPAGLEHPDRPRSRPPRRSRTRSVAVQRAE